eukprot:Hpha_TRINITY_DN9630_c1_g3::TRINITY_DN9630_c1_g3_i1::g.184469::m.184469
MGCCFGSEKNPFLDDDWVFGSEIRIPLHMVGERPDFTLKRCYYLEQQRHHTHSGWHFEIASVGESLSSCGVVSGMLLMEMGGIPIDTGKYGRPSEDELKIYWDKYQAGEVGPLYDNTEVEDEKISFIERLWASYKKSAYAMGQDEINLTVDIPSTVKYTDKVIVDTRSAYMPLHRRHLYFVLEENCEMITVEIQPSTNLPCEELMVQSPFTCDLLSSVTKGVYLEVPWRWEKELCKGCLGFETYAPGRPHDTAQLMLQRVPRDAACVKAGLVPGAVVENATVLTDGESWSVCATDDFEREWQGRWDSALCSVRRGSKFEVQFKVYKGLRTPKEWTAPNGTVWLVLDTPQEYGQDTLSLWPRIRDEQDVKYFDRLAGKFCFPMLLPPVPRVVYDLAGVEKMKEVSVLHHSACTVSPQGIKLNPPERYGIFVLRPCKSLHRAGHEAVSPADEKYLRTLEEKVFDRHIKWMEAMSDEERIELDTQAYQPLLSFVRPPACGAHFSLVR